MKYYTISKQDVDLYVDVVNGDFELFKLNGGKIYEIDQGQVSGMVKHGGWLVDSTNESFRVIANDNHSSPKDTIRYDWRKSPVYHGSEVEV